MYIAAMSLKQNQRHQQLSVRPWCSGHYRIQTDQELSFEIENRGLGPAIIKTWAFWHKSTPKERVETAQTGELENLINKFMPNTNVNFTYSSRKRNSVLQPGEIWKVFELRASKSNPVEMAQVKPIIEGFCMEIIYESFYGESFSETVSRWK